jgi:hypothetical protein
MASVVLVGPVVRKILETGAWHKRKVVQLGGEIVEFDSFADFIRTPPLRGCGWDLNEMDALIKRLASITDDPELLAMWRGAIAGKKAGAKQ